MSLEARRAIGLAAAAAVSVLAGALSARQPQTSAAGSAGASLLAPAPPAVRSPYLDAVPTPPPQAVAPGTPFTLAVDVVPKKGIHVYAPGNAGYEPIALILEPTTGLVIGDVKYPAAEPYFFAPLKERWRVYSTAFALRRTVTVDRSPAAALALSASPAVTVKGRLSYQACDDKVCYLPQSVPLTWTVTIRR